MKYTNITVEKIVQEPGINGMYRQIEIGGRNAYQSESKKGISSKQFTEMLIKRGHLSCLEHGTVYLRIPVLKSEWGVSYTPWTFYSQNPYSKCTFRTRGYRNDDKYNLLYVTTNLRVLVENDILDELKMFKYVPAYHRHRTTFRIAGLISITREYNRHRILSITEQSTRYCNFSKDKFGNEITYIKPEWYNTEHPTGREYSFDNALALAESSYFKMLNEYELAPQEARDLLPLCTASKVVYTAFDDDWRDIIDKRIIPQAHPQAQKIAKCLKSLL